MASTLASRLARVAAIACRALAWTLLALAAADAVLPAGARTALLAANGLVTRLLPAAISGLFVFQTPAGGALAGRLHARCYHVARARLGAGARALARRAAARGGKSWGT